ncbi:hypothetical protein ACXET9_08325 [Brachybacterium sp. DNPG3]
MSARPARRLRADAPVGPHVGPALDRRALLGRGALGLAGAGAAALALSACTADDDRTAPGIAVVLPGRPSGVDGLVALPDDLDHAVELPGMRCRVESSVLLDSLPRRVGAELGLPAPSLATSETWFPADGEKYLIALVVAQGARTMALEWPEGADYTDRAVIGGTEVESVLGPLRPYTADPLQDRGARTIVASVPADLAAADAIIEIADGDMLQSLSLLDGTRVASDIESWYAQAATAAPERRAWERDDDRLAGGPLLAGCVADVEVSPVRADGTWPADGRVVLGVALAVLVPLPGAVETSTFALVLPDGSEAEPDGDPSAAFASQGGTRIRFEVPGDLDAATVRLALSAEIDGEPVDLGTEEIAVTITREDR